jgi:hypothetical protein
MANVLMVPASGAIIFDSQAAQSSIISPLSAAPRLSYDNAGGLNITSYTTAASALDRFSVDGSNGRLFSVSDALTGIIFSVNDASGLPVIEVESNLTDKITIGAYGSNALVVNDTKVGIGTATPNEKLTVVGVISSTNIVYASGGNSNLWNSAYATVNSISANGATTYTTVNANSANWSSVYSTVCATSANYILDGGNTKGANILIGTNDNFNLNLETGGTTKMTVTSSGNVGIGTTAPSTSLHIYSGSSEFARFQRGTPSGTGSIGIYQQDSNRLILGYNSDVGGGQATGGIASAGVIRGDAGLHLISGSLALGGITVTTSGNVGIGTITPNANLTVVGVISSTNIVYASGGNSNLWNSAYATVNSISANGATTYTTVNANSASWSSAYTAVAPNSASWNSVYSAYNTNSANIVDLIQNSSTQGRIEYSTLPTGILTVDLSNLGQGGSPQFTNLTVTGNLSVTGDFTYLNTSVSVTSALSVVNAGTGPALYIKQSGNTPIAYFLDADGTGDIIFENNGFVGLGTASPNNRLTVVGVISSTNIIYASGGNSDLWNSTYTSVNANSANGATTYTTVNANSANWSSVYSTVCAASANYILDGGNTKSNNITIGTNDNFNLNLETAGTTIVTVTSAGNVGIGTTTAAAKLQIIHDASTNPLDIRRTGFLGSQLFTISNLGDITGGAAVFTPKLGHAVPGLTVTGNGTNPTAIFQTGNVGIGTTTPNANLTVVGVISSTNIVYASGGNSDQWNSVYSNVNASSARRDSVYTTTNTNSANWSNAYTNVNANSSNWNTTYNTVNTNSSNWTFAYNQVNSGYLNWNSTYTTVNANSANWSSVYSTVCAASANYILDGGNTKGANILIGTNDNYALNLETAGTTKVTVTSAGLVGIGVADPVTKLQINNKVIDNAGFVYDTNSLLVTHQTPTATATLNDPKTVLVLARQGTSGQAFGAAAAFNLSRFESFSTNSRTRLDISLANGSFDVNSNNILTMLSNGNVGIGNTAPAYPLSIGTNIAGGGSDFTVQTSAAAAKLVLSSQSTYMAFGANPQVSTANGVPTGASFGSLSNGGRTTVGSLLTAAGGATYINFSTNGAQTGLHVTHNFGSDLMTILSNGNVGIGTTTPAEKLTVSGNISANGTLAVTATNQSDGIGVVGNNTTAGIGMRINNTGAGGSDWWLYSSGSAPTAGLGSFALWNNNTSKYALWATSAGVVTFSNGIRIPTQFSHFGVGTYGTVSETNGGLAYITGNNIKASTTVNNQVEKVTSGANPAQFIRMRYDQGISLHTGVGAGDAAGTNYADDINSRLIVNLTGNVGIGTVSPGEKLTVAGNISSSNVIYASGGNSNLWNQNTSALYQATSGQFAVKNANNYFSASQSLTGDVTVRGAVYIDKGDGPPLQEVATKNFSIAMAIALA